MRNLVVGALAGAALFTAACGVTPPAEELNVEASHSQLKAAPSADFQPSSRVHVMPFRDPNAAVTPSPYATTAHLTYYGGKVLQNVKIVAVFWGPNVNTTITGGIGGFYSAVTGSAYFDWLTEYNTTSPAQAIGHGTYYGAVTITPSITGTSLTDAQIQTEINNQINSGKLPVPDANTLYMTYFPAGVSITQGGSSSCVSGGFCAYHGTFNGTKGEIYYGVMPDMAPGSGCNTGCGSNATWFNNATSVSSHEMIEAVTDAEVGLSTVVGAPLAWYDSTNGEIGDICNAQQGSVAGYTVQAEWSNSANKCQVTGTTSSGGGALQNGGFESGNTIWTATSGVINNDSTLSHAGSWEAYLDGYGTTHTDTLSQSFAVPSTATTLTYWLKITTAETTTTNAYDKLTVTLKNSAGTVLATQSYSNLNKSTSYAQKSFTVSSYRGQTLTLSFSGTEDSSLQTSFLVDDVSVQ